MRFRLIAGLLALSIASATAQTASVPLSNPLLKGTADFSGISNKSTVRGHLGLSIGTDVEAFNAFLATLASQGNVAFSQLSGLPTTAAGYGITNGAAIDALGARSTSGTGAILGQVNPTITNPTIAKIANLTANGFVKTINSDGTLSSAGSTVSLTSDVTGTLGLVNGGTGAITAPAALSNLGLDGELFVMAHFSNTDQKLFISTSRDGVTWFNLNGGSPVFSYPGYTGAYDPTCIRDTRIYYDASTSTFYVSHTPFDYHYAARILSSKDLLTWTAVYNIPSPSDATATGLYGGPQWFTDRAGALHILFSGGKDSDFANSYIWETHPSVAGVYTAWSTPVKITSFQYATDFHVFTSPDDANYHVFWVKLDGTGGQVRNAHCATLTGSYTNDADIGFAPYEGIIVQRLPDASPAPWRLYIEPGNGVSPSGYSYNDLNSSFVPVGGLHHVVSTVDMRSGHFIKCRTALGGAFMSASPMVGTMAVQGADHVAITGGTASLSTLTSATATTTGQMKLNPDDSWNSGGILFDRNNTGTCAFLGEYSSGHALGAVMGSGGMVWTNNARNADIMTLSNAGALALGGTINATGSGSFSSISTGIGTFTNQLKLSPDASWMSGGILFDRSNTGTCAFLGEYSSGHALGAVLGSGGMTWTNNARNADIMTLSNAGALALTGTFTLSGLSTFNGGAKVASGQQLEVAGTMKDRAGSTGSTGQIWKHDGTGGAWTTPESRPLFVAVADKTIANSTAATTLFGTGSTNSSLSIPVALFTQGGGVEINLSGVYGTHATVAPTLTFNVKLGATTVSTKTTGTLPINMSGTGAVWQMSVRIITRTAGASGVVQTGGEFYYKDTGAAAGNLNGITHTNTTAIDLTGALTLDVTSTWSAAQTSNTITCYQAVVRPIPAP